MTSRYQLERALEDAKREHTVTVFHGLTLVSFLLPHRNVHGVNYFQRSPLVRLFTPIADAYAGSKIDEFRKKTGYKKQPGADFDLADALACKRKGEPQAYDLSAMLAHSAQSLKEIRLCSDLKLNFFINDFGAGRTSRTVQPHISPVFNKAVVDSWTAPLPEKFVAAFRRMASVNQLGTDDLKLGYDVYVPSHRMDFQLRRGLKILAHINHELDRNQSIGNEDRKFWGYIKHAIAPR